MPRSLRALAAAAALILILLSYGCSEKLAKQKGLTDAALFARGQQLVERKKYEDAAEAFQMLVERFPNSPLAPQAQLGLATSRMNLEENVEAEVAFDDFLRLYPGDPKVPDALFLKGDLLHRQILVPGRDQTKTRESIETYRKFLEKEKGTPRAEFAASRIKEMRAHLLLNEETIISHLLNRKMYESAELRAKRALEDYPDVAPTPTLLSQLALALGGQGKKEESAQVQTELAEKFPDAGEKKESTFFGFAKSTGAAVPFQGRRNRYEVKISPLYMASKDIGVAGGSKLELDPAFGIGVGFGYNFTDRFALHLDGTWSRADYTASIPATAGGVTTTTKADGTLDLGTIALNASYYFLKGPLTPFVTGGIGLTWVDSNIPSGPADQVCWYDPWYGNVCESYENTYTKTYFSYNLGLGVRWDVMDGFFMRGTVGWQWVDLGRPGTTDFLGGRLDLGYMF